MIVFTFCSGNGREGSSIGGETVTGGRSTSAYGSLATGNLWVRSLMFHMHTHAGTSWRLQWGYVSKQTESVD